MPHQPEPDYQLDDRGDYSGEEGAKDSANHRSNDDRKYSVTEFGLFFTND